MCGIAGIVGRGHVNQQLYDALTVLQHREQDDHPAGEAERHAEHAIQHAQPGELHQAEQQLAGQRHRDQGQHEQQRKGEDVAPGFIVDETGEQVRQAIREHHSDNEAEHPARQRERLAHEAAQQADEHR